MAFGQALNADDEQKQQSMQQSFAPPALGGGGAGSTPAGGAAPGAQQSQAGSGTGFVNLQSYLNTNGNDRGGDLSKASGASLDKEATRFGDATKDIKAATTKVGTAPTGADVSGAFTAAAGTDTSMVRPPAPAQSQGSISPVLATLQPNGVVAGGGRGVSLPSGEGGAQANGLASSRFNPVTTGTLAGGPTITNQPMSSGKGYDLLNGWLNASYDGPMSVNYSPDAANAKQLAQNSEAKTALAGTYGDKMKAGPYSLGNEMMDQALFQGDANVHAAANDTKQKVDDFDKKTGDEVLDLETKAQKAVDQAKNTRELTRATLGTLADQTGTAIDSRVKERTDAENADRQNGVVRDPNTGKVVSTPKGQVAGDWEDGTGANRANTANDTERAQYSALSKLLGIDDLGAKSDYVSGRTTTRVDPNKAPPQLKVESFTPDQQHIYDTYIQLGYSEQQAHDAAKSMEDRGAPIFQNAPAKAAPPAAAAPAAPAPGYVSTRRW